MNDLKINQWSKRQLQILMDAKSYKHSQTDSDWVAVFLKCPVSEGKIDFIDPDLIKLQNANLIEVRSEFTVELTHDFMMEGEWEYQFQTLKNESVPKAWQRFRIYYHHKTGLIPPEETLKYPQMWVAKYHVRFIGV